MAKETDLTVREGASVQFVADQKAKGKEGKQPVFFSVDSEMRLTSLVSESVVIRFDQAGTRTVTARYTDDKGKAVEQTLLVEVLPRIELGAIAAHFDGVAAARQDKQDRDERCPNPRKRRADGCEAVRCGSSWPGLHDNPPGVGVWCVRLVRGGVDMLQL